jgi:hypothetical protein
MVERTRLPLMDVYTRALSTMAKVVSALQDEPDPDGTLADMADRLEAKRAWVLAMMSLGAEPSRPPDWVRQRRERLG